jgi:L-rhamnonate dehydratase
MSRQLPRVKEVRAYVMEAKGGHGADCHDVQDKHWIDGYPVPIANPMSGYSIYAQSRKSWGINALGTLVVEVLAEDGTSGVGVSIGGEPGTVAVAVS